MVTLKLEDPETLSWDLVAFEENQGILQGLPQNWLGIWDWGCACCDVPVGLLFDCISKMGATLRPRVCRCFAEHKP